ncbi:MAG: MDR family oxidoreductase [Rhodospirillales bacterium]
MSQDNRFTAIVLDETDGKVNASIKTLDDDALPVGDVTVAVSYSTLNYKDGMILNGLGGMVRSYPHVPGIDFAGRVSASESAEFKPGDEVILTGWRVGEIHWGGYAGKARVKSDWLVPLPKGLTCRQAMAIGTAGFTAMLALIALEERGLKAENEGEVLITGAAGGVGSVAVALLSTLGFRVAASTGRPETHDYLRDLGAAGIIDRSELEVPPDKPLGPERWAGVIDCVGGAILANALATLRRRRSCAAVGLAASPNLETSVLPFLLRGINLLGIESTNCPVDLRLYAWKRLSTEMARDKLDRMTNVIPLAGVIEEGGKILQGRIRGRTVVDLQG